MIDDADDGVNAAADHALLITGLGGSRRRLALCRAPRPVLR
jgi:hypothetical protein